jgi:hypothetical protein
MFQVVSISEYLMQILSIVQGADFKDMFLNEASALYSALKSSLNTISGHSLFSFDQFSFKTV